MINETLKGYGSSAVFSIKAWVTFRLSIERAKNRNTFNRIILVTKNN